MENRNYKRWTAAEDSLLRRGATKLPGRTDKSVHQRRRTLGLVKSSHWTEDEIKLAQQGIVPSGRTKAAFRCLRNKLGITNKTKVGANGQCELNLTTTSAHTNTHIQTVVGNFVRTVLILHRGGMKNEDIADQLGKTVAQIDQALVLASSLRLK